MHIMVDSTSQWEYWGIGIMRYWNWEIFKIEDIGIFSYLAIEIINFWDIGIFRYLENEKCWDIGILRYWNKELLDNMILSKILQTFGKEFINSYIGDYLIV